MAEAYANINPTIVTFGGWLEKTNRLLSALSSIIVTTSANSSGGVTSGNAYVNGILAANTITATQGIRGGTVSASANLVMSSNLDISGQTLITGNAAIFGSSAWLVANGNWGFGTSAPSYPVDVYSAANTILRVRGYEPSLMLASNNRSWYISVSGPGGRFHIYDQAAGSERVSISNTGNFGIGNTQPQHTLSVHGNSYFSDSLYIKSTAGLNANGSFGSNGYVLTSNGSALYWGAAASVTFGGSNTNVLFNDSTTANSSSSFTYDKNTQNMYVANTVQTNNISANAITVGAVNTINSSALSLSGRLVANGSNGVAGYVLTSSGNTGNVYWSLFTGGLIAGNGLGSNATHYFVNANTGLVSNSSGLFVSGPQSIPTLATGNTTVTGFLSVSNNVTVGNTSLFPGVISVGNSTSNSTLAEFGARLQVPILRGFREEVSANTTASGAMTMDLNYGVFRWTLTGNVSSISFSNAPANNTVYSGTLHVTRNGTANSTNRTITFPATTKWAGGLEPPATANANAIDVYQFWTIDGGASYIWSMAIKDAR